jgi:type II secretory pathway component PulM
VNVKAWFLRFDQREQLSLMLLALAVGLYLLYMLLWNPLAGKRDALVEQNLRVAESLQRVDAMVSEIQHLRESGGGAARPQRNLTALVNRTTSAAGLQVSRLQPNSRGEIQVRLEGVAFDELVVWLHQVEYQHGLLVREVALTTSGSDGRVNATVRVAQAG